MGRVHDPAVVTSQPSDPRPAGRDAWMAAALPLAVALPLAFWHTGFHVVPRATGDWRGLSDAPGLLRVVASLLAGLVVARLLSRHPGAVRRPLLALALAAAPLVPVVTGHATALLAFQGPIVVVVAAAALAVAARHVVAPAIGSAPREIVLFAAALVFYGLLGTRIPGPAGPQGDEPHYLAMAHSLLNDGDLDLSDEFAQREYREFYAGTLEAHRSPASPPGTIYPVHTPGLAVLILPAYALGGYAGARLLLSALAALTGVLVHRLVRDALGSRGLALAVWAALTLTPPLPFYAVALYPETPAALATALYLLTARRDPRGRDVALAAVAAAALPWLHPKFLPLAALGLGLTLVRRCPWRARVPALLAAAASIALLLLFFHGVYGRASLSAAYGPGFSSDVSLSRIPRGAAALLLDRQFGLLAVAPLFALALPGAFALWRWRTGDALRAALLGGATLAVGASFSMWWGGACPPARFVIPALPAVALALAPALRARPGVGAALGGIGLAVVALAADAPRALHNRADGESGLLRFLAPSLDLDGSLPSFVLDGRVAILLSVTLLAALAIAWLRGGKGLLLGALAYGLVAAGVREGPLIDERRATLSLLASWDETNLVGASGPASPASLSVPLELRGAPWTVTARELRNSGRLDLPPGLYRVDVRGRGRAGAPRLKTTRLDVTAGELLLERVYLEDGQEGLSFPLLLPAGARRLVLTAVGVQGEGRVEEVRVGPEALVPRSLRGGFPWPRVPEENRYRVGPGAVRATVLDRSVPEADGFRLDGSEGAFLVESPRTGHVRLRLVRPRPDLGDAIVWGGRTIPLRGPAETTLDLAAEGGVVLGSTAVVRLDVRSDGAWLSVSGPG